MKGIFYFTSDLADRLATPGTIEEMAENPDRTRLAGVLEENEEIVIFSKRIRIGGARSEQKTTHVKYACSGGCEFYVRGKSLPDKVLLTDIPLRAS